MPAKAHDFFETPPSDTSIWRYMDFTKFVDLLEHEALYFRRSDLYDDRFEGSVPVQNPAAYRAYMRQVAPQLPDSVFDTVSESRRRHRTRIYLNCWHMNECESVAMWQLYTRANEAIAIRSTYQALRDCLPDEPIAHIGKVNYIDYKTSLIPENNLFWPFLHKRLSFAHEQELRAVILHIPRDEHGPTDYPAEMPSGKPIAVELDRLINAVYISPTAQGWFHDLVRSVVQRYGLSKKVFQSDLNADPVF